MIELWSTNFNPPSLIFIFPLARALFPWGIYFYFQNYVNKNTGLVHCNSVHIIIQFTLFPVLTCPQFQQTSDFVDICRGQAGFDLKPLTVVGRCGGPTEIPSGPAKCLHNSKTKFLQMHQLSIGFNPVIHHLITILLVILSCSLFVYGHSYLYNWSSI